MLKIGARSSRDGQVESDLVPTARGIGPDGPDEIKSRFVHFTLLFCART